MLFIKYLKNQLNFIVICDHLYHVSAILDSLSFSSVLDRYSNVKCEGSSRNLSLDIGLLDFGASYSVILKGVSSQSRCGYKYISALTSEPQQRNYTITQPFAFQTGKYN